MGDGVGRWGKQGELWECTHTQSVTFQTQLLEETMLKLGQEGLSRSHLAQPSPAERCRIFHQLPTPSIPSPLRSRRPRGAPLQLSPFALVARRWLSARSETSWPR